MFHIRQTVVYVIFYILLFYSAKFGNQKDLLKTMNKQTVSSVKFGFLIGISIILLSSVWRVIYPLGDYDNFYLKAIDFVIVLTLMYITSADIRKSTNGFKNFGSAFKSLFIMAVIISLCITVNNFIVFKYVDPEMVSKLETAKVDQIVNRLESLGVDQDSIDEAVRPLKNGSLKNKLEPTFKNELIAFLFSLGLYSLTSLVVAAVHKKNATVSEQSLESAYLG